MRRVTIASLQKLIDAMKENELTNSAILNKEIVARETAQKELKQSREHFKEIKERLHFAELDNARLRGYLDRVHERDDEVAELVPAPNERPTLTVPKTQLVRGGCNQLDTINTYGLAREREIKDRGHWTSY